MIGLLLWDPLLFTLNQMRTSLTGPPYKEKKKDTKKAIPKSCAYFYQIDYVLSILRILYLIQY